MNSCFDSRHFISSHLDNARNNWSIGAYGAVADFSIDAEENVVRHSLPDYEELVTSKGAIRINILPSMTPVAWEHSWGTDGTSWIQSVALALPVSEIQGFGGASVLTEIGKDTQAIHKDSTNAVLFDMGVGFDHVKFCVRTLDEQLIEKLRKRVGEHWSVENTWVNDIVKASKVHRVIMTPLGRVEVFQPIPPPYGKTPTGPHTHFLPALLRTGLVSSKLIPIAPGYTPCLSLEPENPVIDHMGLPVPWNQEAFDHFQKLLFEFGDERYTACKQQAIEMLNSNDASKMKERIQDSIFARALSVVLRQSRDESLKKRYGALFEVDFPKSKSDRVFTVEEVAVHNKEDDCWMIVDLQVYNVTSFVYGHPGGSDLMLSYAGKDATEAFFSVSHSKSAKMLLNAFHIGEIQCEEVAKLN